MLNLPLIRQVAERLESEPCPDICRARQAATGTGNHLPSCPRLAAFLLREATDLRAGFPRFGGHVHHGLDLPAEAGHDDDKVNVVVIAGDTSEPTIGLSLHSGGLAASFSVDPAGAERLGALLLAAAEDTRTNAPEGSPR
jgi:hypothetical protein